MTRYPVHTIESAPEPARATLADLRSQLGLVPNLAATMAAAPSLIKGFVALRETYHRDGTLTPLEIQVLSLTNAFEYGCDYCMALHSTLALKEGLSDRSLAELRAGRTPLEPKLAALSDFSRRLVREHGRVGERDLEAFRRAGYTDAQALEVVLGVAASLLPAFANHLTAAPLDPPFRAQAWAPEAAVAGASR